MVGGVWVNIAPPPMDPVEEVGIVASARRDALLRKHAFRLRSEDLEDCFSQATLELMLRARRGVSFASRGHLVNALEQRFMSRVQDRRRALAGRSPMQAAIEGARPLGEGVGLVDVADTRAELERLVLLRQELRRICELACGLTGDQRLVLATQVGLQMPRADFCARYGWSVEKYRKVAQRARARLRSLMSLDTGEVPPRTPRSEQPGGLPMRISPPQHGPVATAAGARSHRRARGTGQRRASGRVPADSPLPGPAARVAEGGSVG
jgi:hypothetical protein